MSQHLTIKLRLLDRYSSELNRQALAVNFVWNYCNETSRKAWSRDRKWLSAYDLHKLTAGCTNELGLHSTTTQRVCTNFTQSRDKKKRAGLRWRNNKSIGWVPFGTGRVQFDGTGFRFFGKTYRTFHLRNNLVAKSKSRIGSFNQDSRGNWYLNFAIEIDCADESNREPVGIDLGLKDFATMSDGEKIGSPKFLRKSEESIAIAQRSNKTRRARNIHRRVANRRKDFLHKESTKIANRYGLIVIGDVKPSRLTKTHLAKSIMDAGWSDFRHMISYKANMHGGKMVEVSEVYTTQTCSCCGALPHGRPRGIAGLGIREWICGGCGTVHDRDVNAAKNILRIGSDTLAEGAAQMRSDQEV